MHLGRCTGEAVLTVWPQRQKIAPDHVLMGGVVTDSRIFLELHGNIAAVLI